MKAPSPLNNQPIPAPAQISGMSARRPQIWCLMVVWLVLVVWLCHWVGWTLGLFTVVVGSGLAWLVVRAVDWICGLFYCQDRKEARGDTMSL